MNDAHLHLIFNHLPIVIPIVGLLVLLAGFVLKSDVVKRVALGIFVLMAYGSTLFDYSLAPVRELAEWPSRLNEVWQSAP